MPQNISLEIAEKLSPNETQHRLEENLFIAQSRKDAAAKNKNETGKLEKEIAFAKNEKQLYSWSIKEMSKEANKNKPR